MAMLSRFTGKFVFPLLCVLFLAGCDQKIDGSNPEAFKASVDKISKTLSEEDAIRLRKSIAILTIKGMNLEALVNGKMSAEELKSSVPKNLYAVFDGKTAAEVIKLGEELRAQQQAKRAAAKDRPTPLLPRPAGIGPAPAAPAAPAEAPSAAPQS